MKKIISIPLTIFLLATVFHSCKKPKNDVEVIESKVEFAFSSNQLKSSDLQGLTSVVVTIEDIQGRVVKNSEKIEIYNMNGSYISQPISLVVGEYKLTRFLVLNANNEVVYASPVVGSAMASQVENPLSILFSIQKDVVSKISPEVLTTVESTPEDFGYATFSFEIAGAFDFLIGAFIYDEISQNYKLTTASIYIYNNNILIYSGPLQGNTGVSAINYDSLSITNRITLPEKYGSYYIEITKSGHISYGKTFTKEELRLYYRKEDKGPLMVMLQEGNYVPPTVTTSAIYNNTGISAVSGGNISGGSLLILKRGVCWSTNPNPTFNDNHTSDGFGSGSFISTITGLVANTQYYVRAYAINSEDTVYGNEIGFDTNSLPLNGLVAYYPFNGNTNDESGYGNNGTNYGATLTTDRNGTANSAYLFDGISNYILVANSSDICPASNLTVSGWIYADGLNDRHFIVDKRITVNDYPFTSYALCASNALNTQSWMSTICTNSVNLHVTSPVTTVVNKWYHLLLTYNGSIESLYVDGVLMSSASKTGDITYSTMGLYIGTSALNDNYMKGKIDDIRIYNRALNEAEIQTLYNE